MFFRLSTMKSFIVIGFLLLSVIALGHSQDEECLTQAGMQQGQAIIEACGGLDNYLEHIADVRKLLLGHTVALDLCNLPLFAEVFLGLWGGGC